MQLEPVIITVLLVLGLAKIFRGPLGSALADRIRGVAAEDPGLVAEVEQLRSRLADVEERLDFAERLLAQAREAEQLPGGTRP
jgi:F0F1-type ATP synthase membrane subunit b/b'